jgi:hypothetical protein
VRRHWLNAGPAAHLLRHHGKATALFACAGGFHRGIQRQDVGLEGNAVDHADDVGDFGHRVDHLVDDLTALLRDLGSTNRELICTAGVFSVLPHRCGQFLHRCSGFFQRRRLLLGSRRQIAVASRNFACGGIDRIGGALDLTDQATEAVHRAVQGIFHVAELTLVIPADVIREVTFGQCSRQPTKVTQSAIGDPHQLVQTLNHVAKGKLEPVNLASHTEVTRIGRVDQPLNLAVDGNEIGFGGAHRLGDAHFLAGQDQACPG